MKVEAQLTDVDLDGYTLDEAIALLRKLKDNFKDDYSNLRFKTRYGYDEHAETSLVGDRPETAPERQKREAREEADRRQQEARDRAAYEMLKAKFGE